MDIIDDHLSYTWSIPLASKSNTFPALQAWALAREAETGTKVGVYRSDNSKLKSESMREWLLSRGSEHQFTAPYTLAHNSRMERLHRTLMGKAHAMRSACNIPVNRWDEFVLTACYLSNQMPVASQDSHTPFECWYGHTPDLSHLREVGCRAFVLIQNKHNPKVYSCSVECILIRYSLDSKAYRCYHRASHKVFVSYNVSFIESHQQGSLPVTTTPSPSSTPSPAPTRSVTIEDIPDIDSPLSTDRLHPPALSPPPPCCSSRATMPSERQCAMDSKPYVSATQQAVLESLSAAERLKALTSGIANGSDALATVFSEEEFASLADLFAAMPDNLEHEFPDDPSTYAEAMASDHTPEWTTTLQDEFNSLRDLSVYKLVPHSPVPHSMKIMCGRPIFKLKHDQHGHPACFKARYVCRGYSAIWGQDYTKTSAPTACLKSFRILAHLRAALDWEIDKIDIKTAFLHGLLESDEVCYMHQPEGFVEPSKEDWVWELQKGLYGMKQGGLVWNRTMNDAMISWGFTRLKCEHCIYYHVDDFLAVGSNKAIISDFKMQLRTKWEISDLGEAKFCLGIALEWDRVNCTICLSQTALIDRIIMQFGLSTAVPVSTPMETGLHLSRRTHDPATDAQCDLMAHTPYRSLVGSLMYLAIGTQPDIAHAVQQLCHHLDCYGPVHWKAAKHVTHYLKGTQLSTLVLGGDHPTHLLGFTDSDFANCPDT